MPFEISADGTIKFQPLAHYEIASIHQTGCALRLILANPGETPATASSAVQVAMTAEQANALARDLQKLAASLLTAPPSGTLRS
jgi:hypothetical protein